MNELSTVYIDGELVPVERASVSVFDSGFNFGDGVFEGMRVYDGGVLLLHEHVARLATSARAIRLPLPLSTDELASEILRWLRANRIDDDFHFRPIVTRGPRHPPRVDPRFASDGPTLVFLGAPIAPTTERGIALVVSRYRRFAPDTLDSKIKSVSYLHAVLAKQDAVDRGADDAVVLDNRGCVAECSASNLFMVRDGVVATPLPIATLDGLTRNLVVGLARELGLEVRERDLTTSDLHGADEIFLSGTGAEITPVVRFEADPVGGGTVGEVTARLRAAYRGAIPAHSTPIG